MACEEYKATRDMDENNYCKIHKIPTEERIEENYFFKYDQLRCGELHGLQTCLSAVAYFFVWVKARTAPKLCWKVALEVVPSKLHGHILA